MISDTSLRIRGVFSLKKTFLVFTFNYKNADYFHFVFCFQRLNRNQ